MRIGLLTSVPSTLDAFFPSWVSAWRDAGHEVVPASGPGPDGAAARLPGAVVLDGVARTPRAAGPRALPALRAWAAPLDVVVTNTATASALVRWAGVRPPVVYFCHGLHWSGRPTGRAAAPAMAERLLLARTAGVVVLNGEDEEWMVRHAPRGVEVLRLAAGVGLEPAAWPAAPPVARDGTLRLAWVGELSARKRPQDAVGVLALLRRAGVDAHLAMLGVGPRRDDVLLAAARRGLAGALALPGREDPRPAYARAHAVLHTAGWEGLPRVLLEAAAVGRPAFGYDVKGVRDAPGTTATGRAGDVAALAAAVLRWWRAGAASPVVARDLLDWRLPHRQVTSLLEQVVGSATR